VDAAAAGATAAAGAAGAASGGRGGGGGGGHGVLGRGVVMPTAGRGSTYLLSSRPFFIGSVRN